MKRSQYIPTLALIMFIFLLGVPKEAIAWTIKGAGTISCGKLISNSSSNVYSNAAEDWFAGFLSGINWATQSNYGKGVHNDAMYQAILQYCRQTPLRDVADASMDVFEQLR